LKKTLSTLAIATTLLGGTAFATSAHANTTVYRNYNSATGEHLYTASNYEWSQLPKQSSYWHQDGGTFAEPDSGANIYRVYNPKSGEHLFTSGSYEKSTLISSGWKDEGVAFHSGGNLPVYRLYNPNAGIGAHLDTADANEKNTLVQRGWKYEGVAWYALSTGNVSTPGEGGSVVAPPSNGGSGAGVGLPSDNNPF